MKAGTLCISPSMSRQNSDHASAAGAVEPVKQQARKPGKKLRCSETIAHSAQLTIATEARLSHAI